jgi:predicted RNase H-like nuclease
LGVDLAWRDSSAGNPANETGVVAIHADGTILYAGWTQGVEQTVAWAEQAAGGASALMFVDAPLVVRNETGQRLCETQVGQRYGRWTVSANTTNLRSPRLAGVRFLTLARGSGWRYSDGSHGPPSSGRVVSETYPYATLVGGVELGYSRERPRYKRKPRRLAVGQWAG